MARLIINTPTSFRKSKFFASNSRKISVDLTPLYQNNKEEGTSNTNETIPFKIDQSFSFFN